MTVGVLHDFSWQRMINAVEAVKERACRAAAALERAGIPYAVAGGNAVAAWVSRVDEDAVRNTNDVDILVRRSDFDAIKQALEGVGFEDHFVNGVHIFIDGPNGKPSRGVHLLFANEKVKDSYPLPTADVTESVPAANYVVVSLEALVNMKLNSYRRKDQVHLQDLLDIGLIDQSWCSRLCPAHAERLQQLIDTPDG
ncbi:MAG TPA: hypothetical protein VK137_16380 [Planctomycetaceae bacterium]|nr:hypothetical protein [Planctomycetaceae bacterium]